MRRIVPWILLAILVFPGKLFAHEHMGRLGLGSFVHEYGSVGDVSDFMKDLAVLYSRELEKETHNNKELYIWPSEDDRYTAEPQEEQARLIAREAFHSVIRQSVEQVDFLTTLRAYGDQLTSVRIRVSSDDIEVVRHPLSRGSDEEGTVGTVNKPVFSVKSSMSLTDRAQLAPTIHANLAELNSKLVYDPFAGGNWHFSIGKSITPRSAVEMVYLRSSSDDQNFLATFHLGF